MLHSPKKTLAVLGLGAVAAAAAFAGPAAAQPSTTIVLKGRGHDARQGLQPARR